MTVTASVGMAAFIAIKAIYKMDDMPLWFNSFGALADFSIGILLLRLAANGGLPRRSFPLLILAVALAAATFMPHAVGWWFDVAAVSIIFPAVILGGVYCRNTGVLT
jgi:hypothetical protein